MNNNANDFHFIQDHFFSFLFKMKKQTFKTDDATKSMRFNFKILMVIKMKTQQEWAWGGVMGVGRGEWGWGLVS